MPAVYSIGLFEEEKEYTLTCDYEGDACIYVLARNSGEGNDKKNIKGDIKLTDKEISDILYLYNANTFFSDTSLELVLNNE